MCSHYRCVQASLPFGTQEIMGQSKGSREPGCAHPSYKCRPWLLVVARAIDEVLALVDLQDGAHAAVLQAWHRVENDLAELCAKDTQEMGCSKRKAELMEILSPDYIALALGFDHSLSLLSLPLPLRSSC